MVGSKKTTVKKSTRKKDSTSYKNKSIFSSALNHSFSGKKKVRKEKTTVAGKAWDFLWHDDSFASWIANIVLAFIIIKFIVYPLLSAIFGTSLPLVAVVSCSMEHQFTDCGEDMLFEVLCASKGEGYVTDLEYWEYCGDFYVERNISFEDFQSYPFDDGFNKGDVIFLKGENPEDIDVGDVLVFKAEIENSYPIIHRVIGKHETESGELVFETKGDHNPAQINNSRINEYDIRKDDIIGVGIARIPYVGYLKIWFVKLLSLVGLA
ncbi:MAG: signal peptidase I [Nanobdellota archaeon]